MSQFPKVVVILAATQVTDGADSRSTLRLRELKAWVVSNRGVLHMAASTPRIDLNEQ